MSKWYYLVDESRQDGSVHGDTWVYSRNAHRDARRKSKRPGTLLVTITKVPIDTYSGTLTHTYVGGKVQPGEGA